ncbi:MAG: ATP-binding cassette domain-containing protein [Polyangiales bacterium]
MLLLRDVSLRLKGALVLRNVSLEIPQGGLFGLIGPGACGKSVLLKVLTGLLTPERGEVYVAGERITGMRDLELAEVRKKIGMLFQNYALFDHMSVFENIAFPLRRLFQLDEAQIGEIVRERLLRVGLPGFEERHPPELSGGQKKRVGIARATAQRAPIVLYDEPTAGLDPVNSQKIYNLIRDEQRAQGSTAVVISSDVGGLLTVADHVAMLHRGELLFAGSAARARNSGIAAVHQFVHGLTEGPL